MHPARIAPRYATLPSARCRASIGSVPARHARDGLHIRRQDSDMAVSLRKGHALHMSTAYQPGAGAGTTGVPQTPQTSRPPITTANQMTGRERNASLAGGALLILLGLTRRSFAGVPLLASGGAILAHGLSGRQPVLARIGALTGRRPSAGSASFSRTLTVGKPPHEVYRFWRDFQNLPRFMHHIESVTPTGDNRSHWVARVPAGNPVEWDAEITEDRPGELICWCSLPESPVKTQGTVRFAPAPAGKGTEVHVLMSYAAPAGLLGAPVSHLLLPITAQQVQQDLHRFKAVVEAGEAATTTGQTSGRA